MADEAQLVDDALKVLNQIRIEYRGQPISVLASQLSQQIAPTMAFDTTPEKGRIEFEETPKKFVEEAAKTISKRGPTYKTPVFKCLDDFEKCKKFSNRNLCRAAFAICVGKHLIPFVKHEKPGS
jgi:hypothetical protein